MVRWLHQYHTDGYRIITGMILPVVVEKAFKNKTMCHIWYRFYASFVTIKS